MGKFKNDRFYHKYRHVVLPAACWVLYIAYEQLAIYLSQGKLSPAWVNLYYYGINIGLFYSQRFLLSRLITRKNPRYLLAVIFTVLELALFILLKFASNHFFAPAKLARVDYYLLVVWDLYRSVYFVGLSILFWTTANIELFRKDALDAEKAQLVAARDKALLEMQLAEAQNAYYQHQLNPHLLFNTLNFIYSKVHENSPEASNGILLLSEILRFSLNEGDVQGKVSLNDEIQQLHNLIGINRLRFNGRLFIDYELDAVHPQYRIIPLILLTLTENLFKHALISDPAHPARLAVTVSPGGELTCFCRNHRKREGIPPGSRHLGIRNVRVRLDQAYGGNYTLEIGETEEFYQLELKINL